MNSEDEPVRVELYVRSLAADSGERQGVVAARLADLDDRGAVDEHAVLVWGDAVPLDADHPLASTVRTIRKWERGKGVDIVGMEERKRGTLVDERRSVVTLPTLALAEYRAGDLACVTPHRRPDGTVCRVDDRLDALAARSPSQAVKPV